jgi:hypothetical protein
MRYTLRYHAMAALPKLAWLASLELDGGDLSVFHGSGVECRSDWMVEGVWDGEFARGDFHRSENFFGSGIRLEGDRVYFVPSSALVDRIFYCIYGRKILVSNSLILLLGFTHATLDRTHNYNKETHAILHGIKAYEREFTVLHPSIKRFYQVYHENMIVRNGEISFEIRTKVHDLVGFEGYYNALKHILVLLKNNYESPMRKIRLDAFTTLSSGYDSTAVSCLAKMLGVRTSFTSQKTGSFVPSWISKDRAIEDGGPVANALQLEAINLDHRSSSISEDELYFYVIDPMQAELAFHSMAAHIEKMCQAAVVFTGYHGDKVWDANLKSKYLNDQIIRGDISGLRLSEIRLKSGFIHVAVPFILARSVESIFKISRSPEMARWRLQNSYDRPIPRRIGESTGVARRLFGMRKKMVSKSQLYPENAQLRRQFFEFLKKDYSISPTFVYGYYVTNTLGVVLLKRCSYLVRTSRPIRRPIFWKEIDLRALLFYWAVDTLSKRTADILQQHMTGPSPSQTPPEHP